MANLQVKNVPSALHRKLRADAKQCGQTVRDLVREVLRRTIEEAEFQARLRTRAPVELGRGAAAAVDEAREERDAELRARHEKKALRTGVEAPLQQGANRSNIRTLRGFATPLERMHRRRDDRLVS